MLTPIDVQAKTFKSGMGYSKADVDSFLTNLYADYETLYRENMNLSIFQRNYSAPSRWIRKFGSMIEGLLSTSCSD